MVHRAHGNRIGRITTAGVITEFAIPTAGSGPSGSRRGRTAPSGSPRSRQPDRADHAPPGVITEFAVATADSEPFGIAAGPDGGPLVHRVQRQPDRADHAATSLVTEFGDLAAGAAAPPRSRRVPMGRSGSRKGGRTRSDGWPTAGTVSEFPVPPGSDPSGSRRDRTERSGSPHRACGQLDRADDRPPGRSTAFPIPTHGQQLPPGITAGPDGALWFTEYSGNKIGRITHGGRDHRVRR